MLFFFPFPTSLRSDVRQLQAWFRRRPQFNSPKHKLLGQAVKAGLTIRLIISLKIHQKAPTAQTQSRGPVPISHREA